MKIINFKKTEFCPFLTVIPPGDSVTDREGGLFCVLSLAGPDPDGSHVFQWLTAVTNSGALFIYCPHSLSSAV